MIVHHGQVKSITLDEIEGAYKIAAILLVFQAIFYGMVSDCEELVGV